MGVAAGQEARTASAASGRTGIFALVRPEARTVLIAGGLILIALFAAILLQLRRDHLLAIQTAEIRLTDLAWATSATVRDTFERTERILLLGARAARDGTASSAAALATLQRLDPLIVNILIIGPDGQLRASRSGLPDFPRFFTNQPFYEAMNGNEGAHRWVGPFADATLGASPVALFVRIPAADDGFGGIAVAIIDAQALARRIGNFSPNVAILLSDQTGRMIAGFRNGAPIAPSDLGGRLSFPLSEKIDGSPVTQRLQGTGRDDLVSSARVPNYPAAVAAVQPAADPLSPWFGSLWLYAIFFAAPCIAGAAMAMSLMRLDRRAETAKRARERIEHRFSAAIAGAKAGIAEFQSAAGHVKLLPSLARLVGQGDGPITLTHDAFRRMVHPEDLRAVRDALDATRFSDVPATATARIAHAGGRWVWMRVTAQSGDDDKLIAIFADITQEKDADRRKTEAETRLQEAIVNAPQGAALWDRDAALVIANPRFAELIGYRGPPLARGMSYDTVMRGTLAEGSDLSEAGLPPHWSVQKLDGVEDGTDELIAIGEIWIHAAHRLTSDGGLLTVMTDITAVKAQEEELVRSQSELTSAIVALERHQTLLEEQASELTTLTARLEMEKQRAEEASRAKTEFLANMSHELRTPLNAIIGFSEIMRAELFGPLGHPKYREYARDVVQSGQGLLELISDILDMSKIESGELVLARETISPSEIASEIMRIVEPRAIERRIRLLRDIEEGITVQADRRALKRTLLNLLSNAIRFNTDGGAARLRVRSTPEAIVFAVEDTGIGIAPQDIPKLGKPFVQLEREGAEQRGTGLGLAVAKALVEMHGGGLAIESAPGKGTIVRFSIPAAMAEAQRETEDA